MQVDDADAPTALEEVPAAQSWQDVLPACAAYVPAAHSVHAGAEALVVKDPAAHIAQDAEPGEEMDPALHGRHVALLVAPVAPEKVPAGHASIGGIPPGQKYPGGPPLPAQESGAAAIPRYS